MAFLSESGAWNIFLNMLVRQREVTMNVYGPKKAKNLFDGQALGFLELSCEH